LKDSVIRFTSSPLTDLMVSMPSIPASASSKGVVTWLSMTSLDAPR
jgi:hypothetical protein